jgi:chaperonin GroES|tara:strand:+ start:883 stop:1185 length:303 start_codon:yes stop_codon:yes gene_type:complete
MTKDKLDFEPLHNRVLIKSMDVEETTKGGIIIADVAKEKPQEGTVVAIGKGAKTEDGKRIPMDVKVGDKVLFGRYAGSEIKVNQVEYTIMKESDIIGTYE